MNVKVLVDYLEGAGGDGFTVLVDLLLSGLGGVGQGQRLETLVNNGGLACLLPVEFIYGKLLDRYFYLYNDLL